MLLSDAAQLALITGLCIGVPIVTGQIVSIILSHKNGSKLDVISDGMTTRADSQTETAGKQATTVKKQAGTIDRLTKE